jgi:hypothetical protein
MLCLKESGKRQINIWEGISFVLIIGICLTFSVFQINIDIIININGAILGFCFIYLLPSLLHIKCAYFPKGKRKLTLLPEH